MRELSIWLGAHATKGDMGVFRSVAELRDHDVTDELIMVRSGRELVDTIRDIDRRGEEPIDHLVVAAHGGPTWLLDDEHGVTTGPPRARDQVSVWELGEVLSLVLSHEPLISLAACLCSRSPTWLLRTRWGRDIGSDWGARAYLPGGQASLSARLRDSLCWHGLTPRVRGHRASGHASALALLSEHQWPAGGASVPLWQLVHGDLEPTAARRRRWVQFVTGELAARWLLGDDLVPDLIRARWGA